MKILCMSDLHGNLPVIKERVDVVIVAGDICPTSNHSSVFQIDWINGNFESWAQSLPCREVLVIAGNHDFALEQRQDRIQTRNYRYLQDSSAHFGGLHFYGTPWQPIFFHWAFNLTEPQLAEKFAMIPMDTDILISHGPPFGICDVVKSEYSGSKSLASRIGQLRLKAVVCGHIHEGYGEGYIGKTRIVNCSLLNGQYQLANKPVLLEI